MIRTATAGRIAFWATVDEYARNLWAELQSLPADAAGFEIDRAVQDAADALRWVADAARWDGLRCAAGAEAVYELVWRHVAGTGPVVAPVAPPAGVPVILPASEAAIPGEPEPVPEAPVVDADRTKKNTKAGRIHPLTCSYADCPTPDFLGTKQQKERQAAGETAFCSPGCRAKHYGGRFFRPMQTMAETVAEEEAVA